MLYRLLGFPVVEMMDRPWAAATPAEFWRKWNRPAEQFLYEDIFKSCGGTRFPRFAILASFFFSGLVHEYLIAASISRFQGYQIIFFGIQGFAVAATARLRPKRALFLWVGATLAFNLATSIFFFAGIAEIFPFYDLPRSLLGRM